MKRTFFIFLSTHQLYRKLYSSNLKLSPLQRCQIDSTMIIQITFCFSPYLILFFFFFPGQHLCLLLCVAPCQQTQNPIPVAHIKFKFTKTTLFSLSLFYFLWLSSDLTCRHVSSGKLTELFYEPDNEKMPKTKPAHLGPLSLHCGAILPTKKKDLKGTNVTNKQDVGGKGRKIHESAL